MEYNDLLNSGVRWYTSLIDGLFKVHSEKEARQGLLICGISHKNTRLFALFPSYINFTRFHLSLPPEKRCFFEIILDSYQKPHFDLDFSPGVEHVDEYFNYFLEIMISTFEELFSPLNLSTDILIFTSHGAKKSFHVIIDNYMHFDNFEAKEFCLRIREKLPEEVKPYLDTSVYSKKQQFRIVGSQKKESGRIKTLLSPWSYKGQRVEYCFRQEPINEGHKLNLLLEASLVSYIGNCALLSYLIKQKEPEITSSEEISSEMAKKAFGLLAQKANVLTFPGGKEGGFASLPYEIRDVVRNVVVLKRLRPSMCRICRRIHYHENPYLIVKQGHVYFDCRRPIKERLYLGFIGNSDLERLFEKAESVSQEKKETESQGKVESSCEIAQKVQGFSSIPLKKLRSQQKN